MKHGPIALIDQHMPTIALACEGGLRDRMAINISEIRARAGHVIGVLTDGDDELANQVDEAIFIPPTPPRLVPIAATVPSADAGLRDWAASRRGHRPAQEPGEVSDSGVSGLRSGD